MTRVVNPSQTLQGFVDVGLIVSVSVPVLSVIRDAATVRPSARSEAVRRSFSLTGSGRRLVPRRRQPSRAAEEYGSTPEVACTPAPGSALMSPLGLRSSLDCRHRRGRSAPSARWWTRRDKRRPTRHRPGDRQQRHDPAPRWCRRGRGRDGPGAVGSDVVSVWFVPVAPAFFTEGPQDALPNGAGSTQFFA